MPVLRPLPLFYIWKGVEFAVAVEGFSAGILHLFFCSTGPGFSFPFSSFVYSIFFTSILFFRILFVQASKTIRAAVNSSSSSSCLPHLPPNVKVCQSSRTNCCLDSVVVSLRLGCCCYCVALHFLCVAPRQMAFACFSFHLFISASVAVALQLIFLLLLCSRRLATFFFFCAAFCRAKMSSVSWVVVVVVGNARFT